MSRTINKEDIYKELDLIQSCITRMANNSFSLKGWHIAATSALIAFFFNNGITNLNLICLLVSFETLAFWYLDSYYLMIERKYRWKYSWVLKNRVNTDSPKINFLFDLNPDMEEMWEVNTNSKGYKLAIKSKEAYKQQKNITAKLYSLKEVVNVMFSNTMEVQYFILFAASILLLICNIIL